MRTIGVVTWFDRITGTGELLLDDGECVAIHTEHTGASDAVESDGARALGARRRDLRPDVAAAFRAGTWGDGGRDY